MLRNSARTRSRAGATLGLLALGAASLLAPPLALAVDFTFSGKIQTDVRFRVQQKEVGSYFDKIDAPTGVSRNQNLVKLKVEAVSGRFSGVAEADLLLYGVSREFDSIGDLALREQVDPYRIDVHAAYIQARDLFVDGLDLRIGQQLVLFGKGDQFNPTNNVNANFLEDPLLFGDQLANLMARVDYTIKNTWTLTGVLVPIFKPAMLPATSKLGLALSDRLPMVDADLRAQIHGEKAFTEKLLQYPTVVERATPVLPDTSAKNMQVFFRLATTLAEQDLAISYYNGRSDIPQPYLNSSKLVQNPICNPADSAECIKGAISTDASLGYPKVQVVGFNAAGQFNALSWISKKIKPVGYRFELGVYIPQESNITILNDTLDFGLYSQPAGEYSYSKGWKFGDKRPTVVPSTPFAKWTLGLDYTFNQYIYANLQWVHGLVDEFGAGDFITEGFTVRKGGVVPGTSGIALLNCAKNHEGCSPLAVETLYPHIADYLVLGLDFKFLSDRALLRLFTIWALSGMYEEKWDATAATRVRTHHSMFTSEGFSAVLYPEFNFNFGNGLELAAGALVMLGDDSTKFGDPAAGGTLIWTRARFSY
jgi:hypothetical protein